MTKFVASPKPNSNIRITLHGRNSVELPAGNLIAREQIKWLYPVEAPCEYCLYATVFNEGGEVLARADIDRWWREADITYLVQEKPPVDNDYSSFTRYNVYQLMGVMFRYALLFNQGIALHSSSIKWRDLGLVFSAPSGTGKSTHVSLWQERFGYEVTVLNDDSPAIRFAGDHPFIFGTPWAGSSDKYCNESAPLSAIVLLEQAPENRIRRLGVDESVPRIMPRFFLPYFDRELMTRAVNIIDRILSKVPVFLLQCRPDQEAVELVYRWII